MGSFLNNDRNVRISRFISAEFLPAIEKYTIHYSYAPITRIANEAKSVLVEWI